MLWEGLGAKWGIPRAWEAQAEVVVIALNQKVVDKFLKVFMEGEGARKVAQPQRSVSPLFPQEVEHSLPPFLCQWQKIWSAQMVETHHHPPL